jgi:hypothetical protein
MVRLAGIEPTTPWFVAKYSIQLSYSRTACDYSIHEFSPKKEPLVLSHVFVICKPHDGLPHRPGNGQMIAFAAAAGDGARRAPERARPRGPLRRTSYQPDDYGAYFRDPAGNKLAVACHAPEP